MEKDEILKKMIFSLFEKEYINYSFLAQYTDYRLFDVSNIPRAIDIMGGTCYVQQEYATLSNDYVPIYQGQDIHPMDINLAFSCNDLDFFAQEKNPEIFFSKIAEYVKKFIDAENKLFINFVRALPSIQMNISDFLAIPTDTEAHSGNYIILPYKENQKKSLEDMRNKVPTFNCIETDILAEDECVVVKNVAISSFSSKLDFIAAYYTGKYSPYLYRRVGLAAHFIEESGIFKCSSKYVKPVIFEEAIFSATEKEKIYYLDF